MGSISNTNPGATLPITASGLGEEAVETKHLKGENTTAAKVKPTEVATLGATSNKFTGKLGINNVAPPTQSTDMGSSNAAIAITLLTEVAGFVNEDRGKLNEVRTCLRNHGLMA